MSDDPFDDLDDRERTGDPFESLADDPDVSTAADSDTGSEPADETDSFEKSDPGEASADTRLDDHPFEDAEVESGARPRRDGTEDPFEGIDVVPGGDPFESGDWSVEGRDGSVWEDLSTSMETEATTTEEGERRLSEVNKHSFCEQCPHFTGPPEIACTHDGTEILAFLDMETVRLADCPIVEERERLENAGTQG
ncbi:MAG: hypothetical protein ABEI57_01925 [Halapricum sp.]